MEEVGGEGPGNRKGIKESVIEEVEIGSPIEPIVTPYGTPSTQTDSIVPKYHLLAVSQQSKDSTAERPKEIVPPKGQKQLHMQTDTQMEQPRLQKGGAEEEEEEGEEEEEERRGGGGERVYL